MYDIRKIQEQVIYRAVESARSGAAAEEIVFGKEGTAKQEDDPAWVKSTMKRLESRFDPEELKRIRMNCQCGYGMDEKLALVKELAASSSSLEEFGNLEKAKAAGLFYADGELYLRFDFCPCPMVAQVDRLESDTWCQCTTGYSKVLFEKAFGCEVDAELLKSIKMGHDVCLMKIIPRGSIWK